MTQDYNEYLAINVLNEQQYVTYRSLSRALKVHSNLAKQMLYEFHRKQNAKRPGSVHATFLITGTKKPQPRSRTNGVHSQDGEDTIMHSSPPLPGSSAPQPEDSAEETAPSRCVSLVKEEQLEHAKATFESITGLHIYSLQEKGLSDVQVLTECNRKIAVDYASEDPLVVWKQYGTIQNLHVKRRTQRRSSPPASGAPISKEGKVTPGVAKQPAALLKQASRESQASEAASGPTSAIATPDPDNVKSTKPSGPKRQDSDIIKSFAKGKTRPKDHGDENPAETSPALDDEHDPSGAFSDDDLEEDMPMQDTDDIRAPTGKSKKERAAELAAMMEVPDETMHDAPTTSNDAEPENAIDVPAVKELEEAKESVVIENGRRRGRKRVMKKKTVKDADGYLVTKEEPAWESFSEEEPALKKTKVPLATTVNKSAGSRKEGKAGKANIMSFFSKK